MEVKLCMMLVRTTYEPANEQDTRMRAAPPFKRKIPPRSIAEVNA
jgi:hypothetical protein